MWTRVSKRFPGADRGTRAWLAGKRKGPGTLGRGDAAAFQSKPVDFSDPGKRVIDLNPEERRTLEAWARAGTTEQLDEAPPLME